MIEKFKLFIDGRKEYHTFRFPKGTKLPERNGEIFLTAAQVKQPYDVYATVNTARRESEVRRHWESCYYQRPYTVCTVDRNGRRRCYTEYESHHGRREVEYIDVYTDRLYELDLLTQGTRTAMAKFNGSHSETDRRYIYQGQCY